LLLLFDIKLTRGIQGAHHVTHAKGADKAVASETSSATLLRWNSPDTRTEMDMATYRALDALRKEGKTDSLMEIDQYEVRRCNRLPAVISLRLYILRQYYMEGADNGSDPAGLKLCRMPGVIATARLKG
jgi:hypothetical protein